MGMMTLIETLRETAACFAEAYTTTVSAGDIASLPREQQRVIVQGVCGAVFDRVADIMQHGETALEAVSPDAVAQYYDGIITRCECLQAVCNQLAAFDTDPEIVNLADTARLLLVQTEHLLNKTEFRGLIPSETW